MAATKRSWSTLKDGENGFSVTVEVAFPALVVTTTDTVPIAVSSGACTLTWVGLT